MDPELAVLASTAAVTVVKLLTTDGWEKAKQALGTLWRRTRPERAERIEAAVVDDRKDLLAARGRGDAVAEGVGEELVTQWDSQLRALLTAYPETADLLRELLDQELRPTLIAITGPQTTTTNTIKAVAKDHSQSIAAGGNVTIRNARMP
jgi:hypothetical protein